MRRGAEESVSTHLLGEHGDVVEISLTSLSDGQREEEPAPVGGEQGLLCLRAERKGSWEKTVHA